MGGYEWGYGRGDMRGRGIWGGGGMGIKGCFYVCVLFLVCLRTDYL